MSKPEEEKTFFVSRRGHQVGINQVDLKGIDVENDQASLSASQPKSAVKESKKSAKTIKSTPGSRSLPKRILVIVVILLIALPVAIGEIVAAQYRNGADNAQQELSQLVQRSVLPLQKKPAITADQLRATATEVNEIATRMCRGGLIDNMAALYPRAKTEHDRCKTVQAKYAALTTGLYELEAQARYLEKVGTIMKNVTTPITDAYAVIGVQLSDWQAASDQLKKLSPPTTMAAAHKELSIRVAAVTKHWSELNTANNTQNASAFLEAEKALAVEYESVRTASTGFTGAVAAAQANVTKNYSALQ